MVVEVEALFVLQRQSGNAHYQLQALPLPRLHRRMSILTRFLLWSSRSEYLRVASVVILISPVTLPPAFLCRSLKPCKRRAHLCNCQTGLWSQLRLLQSQLSWILPKSSLPRLLLHPSWAFGHLTFWGAFHGDLGDYIWARGNLCAHLRLVRAHS